MTQTLRGLLRGARVDRATADAARSDLGQLGVRRHPDAPLLRRAWDLRDVCTTDDALYVALAEALDVTLVTRNARLVQAVRGLLDVSPA